MLSDRLQPRFNKGETPKVDARVSESEDILYVIRLIWMLKSQSDPIPQTRPNIGNFFFDKAFMVRLRTFQLTLYLEKKNKKTLHIPEH